MTFIGILLSIASAFIFYILVFLLFPKLFLKFKYSRSLKEGDKNEDFTFYIPDKISEVAIVKYELVKNNNKGKKYAVITLKDSIDVISLAIYSFNYKKQAIDFMIVDYLRPENKVVVEVRDETFGLNIQVVSYNNTPLMNIEQEKKLCLFRSELVLYSAFVGFSTTVFAFLFTLGISIASAESYDLTSIFYIYTDILNFGVTLLFAILTFMLSAIASYFIIFYVNRRYFVED